MLQQRSMLGSARCANVTPFTCGPRPCRGRPAAPAAAAPQGSSCLAPTWTLVAAVAGRPAAQLRRQRSLAPVRAAEGEGDAPSAFDFDEPETAKEGIDLGLVLCKQGKWQKALEVFEKSLTLPGTGVKRFRDKPRLISDGEKMALLFNIACCHSQLQDARSGLVALGGCMEAGYTDFRQIRSDPDLEFLRADSRFEGLMERFEKTSSGLFGGFDLGGIFKK